MSNQNLFSKALLGGLMGIAESLLNSSSSCGHDAICETCGNCCECGECTCDHHNCHALMIGGLIGVALGTTAALLLAPQSGKELREALEDKYETVRDKSEEIRDTLNSKGAAAMEYVSDWKELLTSVVGKLSAKKGLHKSSNINDIVEWASLAIRLLQQLQKGR